MRWAPFLIALALALVMDASLMSALELGGVAPSLVAALVAFVALQASRSAAWYAAVVAGVALDLSSPMPYDGRELVVIGPWGLGFAFGIVLVLAVRGSLMRRNLLAMAIVVFIMLMAASLVWCAAWSARAWLPESLPPWGDGSVFSAFGERFRWALWSSAIAVPAGWLLLRSVSLWGFPGVAGRPLRR